ncbi:hypothetical protein ARMSODRAFT_962509 [Armillaria solidipes]|uniref:Uncharacterized protein n=1 Tax=Armillaria solidipes TaxID=1076256 RepID=A0A2H3BHI0_9AGAR|nr:hypothetical protein ARMSODRAFT_962509 [Armillaria solidipes]
MPHVSSPGDGLLLKYRGTLADRMQALRDDSLTVRMSKHLLRQHSSPGQSPSSPVHAVRHSRMLPPPSPSTSPVMALSGSPPSP